MLQAKFKGIVFRVEEHQIEGSYWLYSGKDLYGLVDTNFKKIIIPIKGEFYNCHKSLIFDFLESEFVLLDFNIVNAEWLKSKMTDYGYTTKDVAEGINSSVDAVYKWQKGEEISGTAKASLFHLFNI